MSYQQSFAIFHWFALGGLFRYRFENRYLQLWIWPQNVLHYSDSRRQNVNEVVMPPSVIDAIAIVDKCNVEEALKVVRITGADNYSKRIIIKR